MHKKLAKKFIFVHLANTIYLKKLRNPTEMLKNA